MQWQHRSWFWCSSNVRNLSQRRLNLQIDLCDRRRLKSASASAQSDQSLCWSHVPSWTSRLSKDEWMRLLTILGGCTGWSESILVTQVLLYILSCVGSYVFSPRKVFYLIIIREISQWNTNYHKTDTMEIRSKHKRNSQFGARQVRVTESNN